MTMRRELSIAALSGQIIQRDSTRLPQAMVESTTEFDYHELPDALREGLEEWCALFTRWAS